MCKSDAHPQAKEGECHAEELNAVHLLPKRDNGDADDDDTLAQRCDRVCVFPSASLTHAQAGASAQVTGEQEAKMEKAKRFCAKWTVPLTQKRKKR